MIAASVAGEVVGVLLEAGVADEGVVVGVVPGDADGDVYKRQVL